MSLKGRTNFGKKKLSILPGIRALDPGERDIVASGTFLNDFRNFVKIWLSELFER